MVAKRKIINHFKFLFLKATNLKNLTGLSAWLLLTAFCFLKKEF